MIVSCAIEQMHLLCSLVPKCTHTSSLIDLQPAIKLYQNMLSGTTFDVEAEFALWRSKCIRGNISANNAFDAFECCPSVYPNIRFLLQIVTPLSVTTASAGRTFSMLHRLKTWLRSSMNDERLTGLALLAVATDISVKPEAIVDNFLK